MFLIFSVVVNSAYWLDCLVGVDGAGGLPDASVGFYLTEAFQSQTNTEKILYNKSR